MKQKVNPIERDFPDLYTACAVTRAMEMKTLENDVNQESILLADTYISQASDEVTFTPCLYQSKGIDHSDSLLTTHSLYSNQGDKHQSLAIEQEKS